MTTFKETNTIFEAKKYAKWLQKKHDTTSTMPTNCSQDKSMSSYSGSRQAKTT
ncbi:hypothetical protein DPMN_105436 [Dreissena polymorpha]|uniref:Uncharacterized protein n=1 Tax=Dreissena polymorpha TaxID=45954 RepID=A0A9D4K2A8_DREPO|nr:hypothetical protein DPMN_105436 [Dreissena polymorpha]